jgi:hypothetical protein
MVFAETGGGQPIVICPSCEPDDPQDDGSACQICRMIIQRDTGESFQWCGAPDAGQYGSSDCEIYSHSNPSEPEYCISAGETCCGYD